MKIQKKVKKKRKNIEKRICKSPQISWLQKIKPKITPWFIIVQIADIVLVTLFVLWLCGYINIIILIAFSSLYISVFIVKEIRKVKKMFTDAASWKER